MTLYSVDNNSFPELTIKDGGYIFCSDCKRLCGISTAQEVLWCPYCGERGEVDWKRPVFVKETNPPEMENDDESDDK